MRVMVAMSGGVDSSVAALLLAQAGHEVVGVTLKLWGGPSDRGCCSVADVDDARRVADDLGIDHHVFNYAEDFEHHVVAPYLDAHGAGRTPNPCIECNRRVKFDLLHRRALALGFDRLATGHHARIVRSSTTGALRLARGVDPAKDQSYVLSMLDDRALATIEFPVGSMTKAKVRRIAAAQRLRTATKADSQDVCFIAGAGGGARSTFIGERIPLRPGRVIDRSGRELGRVPAVELVTLGQRKGLGLGGGAAPRYVLEVDRPSAVVTVGDAADLLTAGVAFGPIEPAGRTIHGPVLAQCSAHGPAPAGVVDGSELRWAAPQKRVAPGQSIVFYDVAAPDEVLGGAIVSGAVVSA